MEQKTDGDTVYVPAEARQPALVEPPKPALPVVPPRPEPSLSGPTVIESKKASHPPAIARSLLEAPTVLSGSPEAAIRPERSDAPGPKQLGDYRIIRELGRGGMGVVYEAEQISLGRHVALKVPPAQALLDPSFLERFRYEARAAAKLHHPNIVPVFGVGEENGVHFYAMQFIPGRNLDSVIGSMGLLGGKPSVAEVESANRPPAASTAHVTLDGEAGEEGLPSPDGEPTGSPRPPPRSGSSGRAGTASEDRGYYRHVARIGRQVADALGYAHREGILHRDIKPANLLLDAQGNVWVTDFGLAKASDSKGLTQSGDVVGTLAYMAPERFSGWSSPQSDIYALGLTLYELLALVPAFRDPDPTRLIRRIKEEEPTRPSKIRRRVPIDLETIALKAMAKEPERRYASAGELVEDLDRYLSGQAIHARPPSSAYLLKVFVKRNRIAFSTAAVVIAILGLAAFGSGQIRSAKRFDENMALGQRRTEQFQELKGRIAALEGKWNALRGAHPSWAPPWERDDELEAWQDLQAARKGIHQSYQNAVLAFNKALEDAPLGSSRRRAPLRALEDLYWNRLQEANGLGGVFIEPEEYKVMIQSLGLGTHAEELEWGTVALESDPPGAEVFCYIYEEFEAHLIPIPFDPRKGKQDIGAGLLGEPFLEVESILRPELSPFKARDRFLKIADRPLRLEGDLAKALGGVKAGEEVQVAVLRGGNEEKVRWVPFPEAPAGGAPGTVPPGRVVNTRDQFGFTLAGYPLPALSACLLGKTAAGSPLEMKLPEGSYLFVFHKAGYRDTRFPVAVPRKGPLRETVRLLQDEEIPEGFVWIPAGALSTGGDQEAFQSLPPGENRVEGFFLGRRETTLREYLEFLNDANVPDGGEITPTLPEVLNELSKLKPPKATLRVIPVNELNNKAFVLKAQGRWALPTPSSLTEDSPVIGVSQLAAQEYAAWYTRVKGKGIKFRLPTDLEWERAARGADRRTFVWGNYPIWSFTWSAKGLNKEIKSFPTRAGIYPLDESVFGVRDLDGSVSEHTTGRTQSEQKYRYTSLRGGNFYNTDDFYFRLATRNGRLPENPGFNTGFRLAADPPARP
jgi:serine/threonine protein kinase/formylglycine-generating enzyme required for sulfatase activity